MTAMGWRNVCWGSDYPHIEGTFGHTQSDGITKGTFEELFPHVPPAPSEASQP
jgi:predicted TIM-barrel fold metal-dependent hydrolase